MVLILGGTFFMGLDVADRAAIELLAEAIFDRLGGVALLMNNAGTSFGGRPFGAYEAWRRTFDVNLFGMNTGSRQGITNPPGGPAYNASKAAIKSLTEGLALSLRNTEGGS